MDLCQRKSRSPLQWPGVDENDHSGQKHEEDFSREESNVMEHISGNHMQPSQLSGKRYLTCNDKQNVFEKFVRETMNKPDSHFRTNVTRNAESDRRHLSSKLVVN